MEPTLPRTITVDRAVFRLRIDSVPHAQVLLDLATFTQPLVVSVGVDTLNAFDRDVSWSPPALVAHTDFERISWLCRSTLWDKIYHLDVHAGHVEFHAEITGVGQVDCIRYFEVIDDATHRPHFDLTKHFNDRADTPARAYARASPTGFTHVFCPEPNSYSRQMFRSHEYAQVSVNADLDHCGGNFVANPGIFAFAMAALPDSEWLAMGLAVPPGEHHFSEFEYLGGHEFGLKVNSWGARRVDGTLCTPRIVLVPGRTPEESLEAYVDTLRVKGWIPSPSRDPALWWTRPIVCGWGHQAYQADLFRVRSPSERRPDNATYTLSTQTNYTDIVRRVDHAGVPWGTLVIDARWFLAGGLKDIDEGRWPDMRGFTDELHRRGKRVLLWWGPWDSDGIPDDQCVRYEPANEGARTNRPGRLAKFGAPGVGRKLTIDITLPCVQQRIRSQIRRLLGDGPGEVNADGLKIDHVAAAPGIYGLAFPPGSTGLFGVEATRLLHETIYRAAKDTRPDALVIGQSPNPYFSDVQDMLRLGDIYTPDSHSVVEEMRFRARMARIADPSWLIDTDGWPMPSINALTQYARHQPDLGVPSLYYITNLDTTGEPLDPDVFGQIRSAWERAGT